MSGSLLPYIGIPVKWVKVFPHNSLGYEYASGATGYWDPVLSSGTDTSYSQMTVEFWIKVGSFPSSTAYYGIMYQGPNNAGDGLAIGANGWKVGNGTTTVAQTITPGTWYAVAITNNSGVGKLFVNGVLISSGFTNAVSAWNIGGSSYTNYMYFGECPTGGSWIQGGASYFLCQTGLTYMAYLRISNNLRYTANYTPASTFPPFNGTDSNTIFLNYPSAGSTNSGALSDWSTYNNYGVAGSFGGLTAYSVVPF